MEKEVFWRVYAILFLENINIRHLFEKYLVKKAGEIQIAFRNGCKAVFFIFQGSKDREEDKKIL